MPEQLKIIIDADVNSAIAGVKELSKVISLDFAKATASAATAANKLSGDVATSVQKINASLDSIKVKPIELSITSKNEIGQLSDLTKKLPKNVVVGVDFDTAILNSEINSLTKKLQSIDLTVNTQGAKAKVNELIAEISKLKEREVLLRADNQPVLNSIIEIESVLKRIQGNIKINADVTGVNKEIQNIQAKFSAIIDPQINVLANTELAEAKIKELLGDLSTLKGSEIFIRANDAQALKVINEVEAELKGILDKQINVSVDTSSVSNASKVISGDFVKASETAAAAGFNLSERFAAATARINASIDKMVADALGKFTQLKSFKPDFGVLTFDTSKVIAGVEQVKAELNSISGKAINLSVNTTNADAGINKVKANINSLQAKPLTIPVDTTTAQKNINTLESKVNSLKTKGVVIPVDANTTKAIAGVDKFKKSLDGLTTGSIAQLRKAASLLKTQLENLSPTDLKGDFGKELSGALKLVEKNLKSLEKESGIAGEKFEDVFKKLGRQIGDFATLLPSVAISSVLLAASELVEDFIKKLFEGKMALNEFQKANSEALGRSGEETIKLGGLVSIARDVTLSTKERKAAIDELQKSYPAYLQNINLENINSAATAKSINDLTDAIFNKALADQFATLAAKKQVDVFEKIQKIRKLADLAGSADSKAQERLARSGLRLENERLDKLIAEREAFKQAFKDAQVDFFDVFKPDTGKPKPEKLLKDQSDEILARARQFVKEFGDTFVVPDLEETFFRGVKELLPEAKKLLDNIAKGNLQIKLPVQVITELDFLPVVGDVKLTDAQLQELTKGFFEGVRLEKNIPIDVTFDPTLAPGSIEKINKKLDLKKQFSVLGDLGLKEFSKIDFSNMNAGIAEATKRLEQMMAIATTLNQAIGQGLAGAFNAVFDAVLEGKSVFKALGNAVKELVVGTIKAVVQMLILRAITAAIFPGGGVGGAGSAIGGAANFGQFTGIGGRAFSNVITVNVVGNISGDTINLAGQRAANSQGRFGG